MSILDIVSPKEHRDNPAERVRLLGKEIGLWSKGYDYANSARQVFGDVSLKGKTVLEIGCGSGVYSIWAAIQGARHVVGLEPVSDGSRSDVCIQRFSKLVDGLGLSNVEVLPIRLQDYRSQQGYFDVALSVASINHLDEPSTVSLRKSVDAQHTYISIFSHIHRMMKPGGKLIIVDASSRNAFGDIGLKNPFTPTVNWSKHQPPHVWAEIAERCRFSHTSTSWLSGKSLRYCGIEALHQMFSYFGASIFRLEMICEDSSSDTRPIR